MMKERRETAVPGELIRLLAVAGPAAERWLANSPLVTARRLSRNVSVVPAAKRTQT